MALPDWAKQALQAADPASARAKWQRDMALSLERRWQELDAESWDVPASHSCYGRGHADAALSPPDLVRARILETVLDLAWDLVNGKKPGQSGEAAKELASLNEQILDGARDLARLFRQRSLLARDHGLADQEYPGGDPFDFWDAFEAVFEHRDFADLAAVSRAEIAALLCAVRSQQRPKPRWPDLLEEITRRQDDAVKITDAGDRAAAGRTKSTEHSRPLRQLFGALSSGWSGTYPDGFLLDPLKPSHLRALAEVVLGVQTGVLTNDAVGKLCRAFKRERA